MKTYIFFIKKKLKSKFCFSKLWQNSKKLIVTKSTNSNCDKTEKLKLWQNSKTQIVTKAQKHKLWQNLKTQIVTILKDSNFDKTQKLKLWQNSKTQIVKKKKLKNWNCKKN